MKIILRCAALVLTVLIVAGILVSYVQTGWAQSVPRIISYQGVVALGGVPATGQHEVHLAIYDSLGGAKRLLYQEDQQPTLSNGGIFNIDIGSVTPIPDSLRFDHPYYLGVRIDGANELLPLVPLASAPYALGAHIAELAKGLVPGAHGVVTSINELAGPLQIVGDSTTSIVENGNIIAIHARTSPQKNIVAGQGIIISGDTISATGGYPAGTTLNSTLRWNGALWTENKDLTSDANGNTKMSGTTTLGDGTGADNITMNPGTGNISVIGFGQGVVKSNTAGVLSVGQVDLTTDVTNLLPVAHGGTGQSNFPVGQLLLGNGTSPITTATLTAGSGISITPGAGTITIANTGAATTSWLLTGNSGTTAPTNFLGTTDQQPFEIHIYDGDGAGHGSRRVMRYEPNATSASLIGGYQGNSVSSGVVGATISGGGLSGFTNLVTDDWGVIGGGTNNRAGDNASSTQSAAYATVGGGGSNTASAQYSSVLGGTGNSASGISASVGGGSSNTASGQYSSVSGGIGNVNSGTNGVIAGGGQNGASGSNSTVSGGQYNSVTGNNSTLSGGTRNFVGGTSSTISGGSRLGMSGDGSFGFNNGTANGDTAFVSSNWTAYVGNVNLWLGNTNNTAGQFRLYGPQNGGVNFPAASTHFSSLSSGMQTADIYYLLPTGQPTTNQVLTATAITGSGPYNVALGWAAAGSGSAWNLTGNSNTTPGTNYLGTSDNQPFEIHVYDGDATANRGSRRVMRIEPNAFSANIIGGYQANAVTSGIIGGTIGGGGGNGEPNIVSGDYATIGGGVGDSATTGATVAGGTNNVAGNTGAVIGGGGHNIARSANSVIGGGGPNVINPSSDYSIIGGGKSNIITGKWSDIPGGDSLTIGAQSFGMNVPGGVAQTSNLDLSAFSNLAYFGNMDLWLGNTDNSARALRFYAPSSSLSYSTRPYSAFLAGSQSATINYTLPTAQPTTNQVLTATNITGAGPYAVTLGWAAAGSGSAWNLTGNSGTTVGTNYLGTNDNQSFEIHVFDGYGTPSQGTGRALRIDPVTGSQGSPNITMGYSGNTIASGATGAVIAGGGENGSINQISSNGIFATLSGGLANTVSSFWSTIGGGSHNTAYGNVAAYYATIGGGGYNRVGAGNGVTIAGGWNDSVSGDYSSIAGGNSNLITGAYSSIGGGFVNRAQSDYSSIGGGYQNAISSTYSIIGGGYGNTISTTYSFIGGGASNSSSSLATYGSLAGGHSNATGGYASTIGGGENNSAAGSYSSISGGQRNTAAAYSTIPGGDSLALGTSSFGVNVPGGSVLSGVINLYPLSNLAYFGNMDLWLANTDSAARAIRFYTPSTSTSYTSRPYSSFVAGLQSSTINYTLPTVQPTTNQVLTATAITGSGPYAVTLGWAAAGSGSAWNLTGNSGTTVGTNFLGTTDNVNLQFRVNNQQAGLIEKGTGTSGFNAALGYQAFISNTSGSNNFAGGYLALHSNTTGNYNAATGMGALTANSSGSMNTAFGTLASQSNTTGQDNTAVGFGPLSANLTGSGNTAIGYNASYYISGDYNTAVGASSLWTNTTGSYNTAMGYFANVSSSGVTNATAIGAYAYAGASDVLVLGSVAGYNTATMDASVGIGTTHPTQKFNEENGNILLSHIPGNAPDTLMLQGTSTGVSSFLAGAQGTATINYTLPTSQPTSNQVLSATAVTGSGPYNVTLGWAAAGGNTAWNLTGNTGTVDGTNFLGTIDNTAFTIRVDNAQAFRIQPAVASTASAIGGGTDNTIVAGDTASFIGFGQDNRIAASNAVILGGGLDTITSNGGYSGIAASYHSVISNQVSMIAGGELNKISGDHAFIAAGYTDTITSFGGFVGGGSHNVVRANSGAIAGGVGNVAYLNSFVGGGNSNYAGTGANSGAAVLGGWNDTAYAAFSGVMGGQYNVVGNNASYSTILGGQDNYITSSNSIIVGGGHLRLAGANDFAFFPGSSSTDSAVISANNTAFLGNVNLWLGNTNNSASQLRMYAPQNGGIAFPGAATHYSGFAAAGLLADINYTLPSSQPTANQVLAATAITGAGPYNVTLGWVAPGGNTAWNLIGNTGTTAGTNYLGTNDNQALIFKTNNAEAARITTTGYVGIGTTAPVHMLNVVDISGQNPAQFENNSSSTPLNYQAAAVLVNRTTGFAPTELSFSHFNASSSNAGFASVDMIPVNMTSGSEAGSLVFGTRTNGPTNVTEKMRITNLGLVGIGTQAPLQLVNAENGNLLLSRTGANVPDTLLLQGSSTGVSTFVSGSQGSTTINYTLPTAQPTTNQVLTASSITGAGPYNVTLGWASGGSTAWNLTGNSGTTAGTNFLGTTDNQNLQFRTSNVQSGIIQYAATAANTGLGYGILASNTTGQGNTATGYQALQANSTGSWNNAFGDQALYSNTSGHDNSAVGSAALYWNSTGNDNIAVGSGGLNLNTTGYFNSAVGINALRSNTTGGFNTALGDSALITNTTGSNNTALGDLANVSANSLTNATSIGSNALVGASNSMVLGSIAGVNSATTDVKVGIGTTTPQQKLNVENGNILLSRTGVNGAGQLQLQGTGTASTTFAAGAQGATAINYTLPTSIGSVNQVLAISSVSGTAAQLGWATTGSGTAWNLSGNTGTTPGTNYLGTSDNSAFEIHIYEGGSSTGGYRRVMRYEPNSISPNITGGFQGNSVSSILVGSIIAGGGYSGYPNSISSANLATISGGDSNRILSTSATGSDYATIGGGHANLVVANSSFNSYYSTIAGGRQNKISGVDGVIAGGERNTISGAYSAIAGGADLTLGNFSFGFNNSTDGQLDSYDANLSSYDSIAYFGNVDVWLGSTGGKRPRQLRFFTNNSSTSFSASNYYTAFQAPASLPSGNITYTLPGSAPAANGNLLLATSASPSVWSWSTGLVWDNTNARLGINTTTPGHPLHSINSSTTDELAAVFGNVTASTTNQAIGVWGDASNTSSSNTGTIGILATGNGSTTAGQTNVALQVNDGELTMGRTTEAPGAGSDVDAATSGTAYSQQGPSGIVELTLGASGNLTTIAPTAGAIQDLGFVTINNRYTQSGSIVLTNVVATIDDGFAPNPQNAAFLLTVDNTTAGSFLIRVKMIPTVGSASNYTSSDKIRIGYMIVNKSR